jgi:hypothetical protein
VVSAALVVEREELGHVLKVQQPVYFISEVLTETKARYTQVQKLLYAVLMATKKLQHYLTNHEVTVVTSFPLGEVVHSRDATGRISKWALELMGYDIEYAPRTAIKSQALADFGHHPRVLDPVLRWVGHGTRCGVRHGADLVRGEQAPPPLPSFKQHR